MFISLLSDSGYLLLIVGEQVLVLAYLLFIMPSTKQRSRNVRAIVAVLLSNLGRTQA